MLMAPVGTPPEIVNKLFDALTKSSVMPDITERGANITLIKSPADTKNFVSSEFKKWNVALKESGVAPD